MAGTFGTYAFPPPTTAPDIFRVVQPLVAGANTITHSLGSSAAQVEVRDATTGALISASVTGETSSSLVINVPVAVASARISIDV